MSAVKTSRPFQERFLDGYNRTQLNRAVQSVKPSQFSSLPKRCVTMALGLSLALTAVAVSLDRETSPPATRRTVPHLATGLQAAEQIAMHTSDRIRADYFLKHVPFGAIIYNAAKKHNVSPELVAAVARAESAFHPGARSNRGAIGVMQLVPRTGRWLGATDLTDPIQNIVAGAKYLRYLSDRFGGNEDHVIAAYNAGEGNVRRFDGVPPFNETRDYVERVHRFQRDLRARMSGQVTDARISEPRLPPYRERLTRPKIDIHWTTAEERRLRRAS
jgi:soluble lytic murein transglycosylase-like protein